MVATVAGIAIGAQAMAAVSAAEAAKLGAELTPLGAREGGQRRRLHSRVGWRPHLRGAGGLRQLPARPASPRPVRQRQAAVHGDLGEHGPVRRSKLTEGHKKLLTDLSQHLQDARVSHASQRRRSAAHLRRHQTHRDHRATGQGRQRRHQRGRGHSFRDPEGRRRGLLEPRAALSRRRHRPADRPGAGHGGRLVHDGEVPRRNHGGLQPAGREVGEPRQHHRVLHPGNRGAGAPRG